MGNGSLEGLRHKQKNLNMSSREAWGLQGIEMNQFKRIMLLSAGLLFTTLGIVGIFLPIMPTVPFLIIASVCFSKSSRKFHNLLLNNRWVGPHIKNFHENHEVKLKTKILLIICQWAGLGITSVFLVHGLFGRILLVAIAAGATFYILSLKTSG